MCVTSRSFFQVMAEAELFKLSLVSVYRFLKRVMSFVFVTQLCFYGCLVIINI